MNSNIQYAISIRDESLKEVLIAELMQQGFEGFEEKENLLLAYIESQYLDELSLIETLRLYNVQFSKNIIEEQNWNAVWESNFQPVIINDAIAIRAHFHQPIKNIQHEIIITPKMSFGTGHHATTYMMAAQLLKIDLEHKTVFDFGTGTGVLAILAEKLGAEHITAIDNDEWSLKNAAENIAENQCYKISLSMYDRPPENESFDVVLANINKSIITDNFKNLVNVTKRNACIILSGLLDADEGEILELASNYRLQHVESNRRDKWLLLYFIKPV